MKVRKIIMEELMNLHFTSKWQLGIYTTTYFNGTRCHNRILQCMEE